MASLGFTFYPKDWWTSDTFYALQPFERYVYLECIFMMYVNDGWLSDNKLNVERRLGTTIKDEVWGKITELFVKDGDLLTHKSVNARLRKTIANRENGKKGGAPNGNLNAKKQPKQPKKTTQNNPPLEIEREIESKIEYNTPTSYTENDNEIKKVVSVDLAMLGKHPIENLKENLSKSRVWFDQVGMKNQIHPEEVILWFEKFCTHCLAQGKEEMTEKDFKSYFANWVTKQRAMGIPLVETFKDSKSKKVDLKQAFQKSIVIEHGK